VVASSLHRVGDPTPGVAGHTAVGSGSAIAPAEGAEALVRLLAHPELGSRVIVSAVPIAEVIEGVRRVTTDAVESSLGDAAGAVVAAGSVVAPRTALEATIANVWSEVLRVEPVGADSDFFDLGGNSLVAVQLITQLRRATGIRLPMRALFEASTVGELAARVEQIRAEGGSPDEQPAESPIPRQARRRDG